MKTIQSILLAVFVVAIGFAANEEPSQTADFYVSVEGSDSWSGTLAVPSQAGDDGPFASLSQARDAVRALKKNKEGDIVVYIREGVYRLDETVVFGLEDSGEEGSTNTYASYPGEKPIFSSAVEIGDWKPLEKPPAALPEVAHGAVIVADVSESFYTLYDGEGSLPRARSDSFAAQVPTSEVDLAAFKKTKNKLYYPEGALKNWANLDDVELHIRPQHAWIDNILPLASVDEKSRIAYTKIPGSYTLRPQIIKLVESDLCWIENVLEELDEPGEWVLNTKEGKLYLWPRSDTPVVRPQLRELIRVEGSIDKKGPSDTPVRNLTFRGLSFMHGDRYTLKENDAGLQHDWDMLDVDNALLRLRGTENCVIENCHFSNSGGNAVRVDLYGQKNRIENNHIEKLGGAGILLCGYGLGTKDVNRNNTVVNNRIHHFGEIYRHSPGIMLWQSGENRVANNLIHDAPYAGIIVSGFLYHFFGRADARELVRTIRWNELEEDAELSNWDAALPFLHSHDNLVEYNEIHHVMQEMGDGNGIYIRGAGAGNIIRRNYIHHLLGPTRMQAAIRTDGGQRDTLIAENIIYKCTSKGIVLKLNNRIENNVIVDPVDAEYLGESIPASFITLRESPVNGATIKRNIFSHSNERTVYFDERKERRFPVMARAKDADTDFNIYFSNSDGGSREADLQKFQDEGVDSHSLAVDPLFIDAENGDYRLMPGSPARELGIVSLDASEMGLKRAAPPAKRNQVEFDWEGESFRNIIYKKIDNYELPMDVYMPPVKKHDASPVIYYVHGGGWAAGSKEKFGGRLFLPVFRDLAAEGFVCVAINYRLIKKNRGVLVRDCIADAMDGLRFLNKNATNFGIDSNRIVVFGDSMGGQLIQMLSVASPNGFAGDKGLVPFGVQPIGAISWYGPTDFTDRELFVTDFSDKNPDRFSERIVGKQISYAQQPKAFEEVSSFYWIKPDSPPMLLIQGNRDETIPLAHAIHLQNKADQIGANVESVVVKNSGHNWRSAGGDPTPSLEEIQRITTAYARKLISK